jgi:2-methylisocitrate lyase-like PEP mutase family enzyme
MKTQLEKAEKLRALHQEQGTFVIPNPWDLGSALLLEGLGFQALATSSAGAAFALGRRDGAMGREAMMAHICEIVEATDLPVSADLENGFGDAPREAAETIRMAAEVGVCGGSIEDATGREEDPIYARELAVERVRAAAEVARGLGFPFTLTARCENFLHGRPDLADTIARLQAYQEGGADVLYAPGLTTREQIRAVVNSVDRPVNVLVGLKGMTLSLNDAAELGVRRLSVGSGLARAAYGELLAASRRMLDAGEFDFGDTISGLSELCALFPQRDKR